VHTNKQYKKKFRIFVASLLLICCIPAKADISASKAKFDVALVADYAQSKDGIEIDSKTFTFKTGSLGVRTAYRTENLGHFFATAGLGYAPSETATFAGASVSGPLHVQSYSLAFIYPYLFPNSDFGIDLRASTTTNKHNGNRLTGFKSGKAVTASVGATSNFNRSSLGVNYFGANDLALSAGIGVYDWKLSATGNGSFDTSDINFSTSAEAVGRDKYYYLEANMPIAMGNLELGLRRSDLTADNKTVLMEVYAGLTIPLG